MAGRGAWMGNRGRLHEGRGTRDIVRNYCKTHALDGFGVDLTANMKEQMQQGTVCLCCGKPHDVREVARVAVIIANMRYMTLSVAMIMRR